jgi:hypothetical protein
MLILSKIVTLS